MGALSILLRALAAGCQKKKIPVSITLPPLALAQAFVAPKPNPPTISEFTAERSRTDRVDLHSSRWEAKDDCVAFIAYRRNDSGILANALTSTILRFIDGTTA